ncbi:MAG: hypothetical protein IJ481_03460 [Alphaproteobacteria bacterium]|nr:hypothetical protein [Alphaproteobacteria bacterium]
MNHKSIFMFLKIIFCIVTIYAFYTSINNTTREKCIHLTNKIVIGPKSNVNITKGKNYWAHDKKYIFKAGDCCWIAYKPLTIDKYYELEIIDAKVFEHGLVFNLICKDELLNNCIITMKQDANLQLEGKSNINNGTINIKKGYLYIKGPFTNIGTINIGTEYIYIYNTLSNKGIIKLHNNLRSIDISNNDYIKGSLLNEAGSIFDISECSILSSCFISKPIIMQEGSILILPKKINEKYSSICRCPPIRLNGTKDKHVIIRVPKECTYIRVPKECTYITNKTNKENLLETIEKITGLTFAGNTDFIKIELER